MTKKSTKNADISEFKPKLKQRQKALTVVNTLVRWLRILLFLSSLYGISLLWSLDFWNIEYVELNGLTKIGHEYISKFELEKSYQNKHLLTINPLELKKSLRNERVFKDISIVRSLFPAKLKIDFVERIPYSSLYEEDQERDVTIDEEGFVLTFNSKTGKKMLFTIKSVKNYHLDSEQINAVKIITTFLKLNKIPDVGIYDISAPDKILLHTNTNNLVILGSLDEIIMKIKTISDLERLSKKSQNELEYINVMDWRNPVLKLKLKKEKGRDPYEKTNSKKELPH